MIDNRIIDERVIERSVENDSNVKELVRTSLNFPFEADEEEEEAVVVEEQREDMEEFADFEEELQEILKNETQSLKQEEVARRLEDVEAENSKSNESQKKKKRRLFGIEKDNILTKKIRN